MGGEAKQIVFRYNDNDTDVEVDILGDLPNYLVDDIIVRRGRSWKVVRILIEQTIVGLQTVPAYIVSLTDE